jgi:hypothetical protein
VFERGLDHFARVRPRFTDAQPTDSVAGKSDFDGALGGLFSESQIHAALNYAEERLGCMRICGAIRSCLLILISVPGYLVLVLFEVFLAAPSPAQG